VFNPCLIFATMNLPSKLLEDAVDQMASLPGIGRKTALRLVLRLLKRDVDHVRNWAESFTKLREGIKECSRCYSLSDSDICSVCSDQSRDSSTICIVEDIRDILALEATGQYRGLYHVLGGIISPMEGIGPQDLNVEELLQRLRNPQNPVAEVILALSTTMEGDTTAFYLFRKLQHFDVNVSAIARGVAIGDELQYADEVTLGRSIAQRQPYESTLPRS